MSKIKVSEIFFSLQGEARYTGTPSVFLRVFGCNFTCQGFGMARGQLSTEADEVAKNVGLYAKLEDLPLVSTGCDSYSSWHPKFKHMSPMLTTDAIVERIMELLPAEQWRKEHLVITGGEPLLGWQRAYPALLEHEKMHSLTELTFETNGTQELSQDFVEYLEKWKAEKNRGYQALTFSVSAKLSCSGERRADAIRPEVINQYQGVGHTYLKLVVATEEDVNEALEVVDIYRNAGFFGDVYLMPVGGVEEVYQLNKQAVANLALKHGLRYSDRLHIPLFGNSWGT